MNFQHLILPVALWLVVGFLVIFFSPASPIVIGTVVIFISLAMYFSLRIFTHGSIPPVASCCVLLLLLSDMFSGFNLINFLLIGAIGSSIVALTK